MEKTNKRHEDTVRRLTRVESFYDPDRSECLTTVLVCMWLGGAAASRTQVYSRFPLSGHLHAGLSPPQNQGVTTGLAWEDES